MRNSGNPPAFEKWDVWWDLPPAATIGAATFHSLMAVEHWKWAVPEVFFMIMSSPSPMAKYLTFCGIQNAMKQTWADEGAPPVIKAAAAKPAGRTSSPQARWCP